MAALVAVAMMLAPQAVPAQTEDALKKDSAAQTLEEASQSLEATQSRTQELIDKRKTLNTEIGELNRQIVDAAERVKLSEAKLTELERSLGEREVRRKGFEADFGRQANKLSGILVSLQRMGANPPPAIITHRRDALSMVRSALMLSKLFPEYRQAALDLRNQLNELDEAIVAERQERDNVKTEHDRLDAERASAETLMDAKRVAMLDTDKELESVRALAKTQAKLVKDTRELVRKMDEAVASKTTLGAYETELALATAKPALDGASGAPAADAADATTGDADAGPPQALEATASLTEPAAEPAPAEVPLGKPLAADVAFLDPGRIKPAMPFGDAKGRLPMPVAGDRVLAFGQLTRSGSKSKGVGFSTREEAQITSPCDGWIVYAGEFRSYDQVLIINAGGGYHLLLAGMAQINVQVGQFVLSGEPVGKMGKPKVAASKDGNPARPILYLELRSKERPINPDPWWGPSGQKVANG